MFETHEDYSKLLAGAHRRRVPRITAPAAIRHLAFWNPPRMGPAEDDEEDGEAHPVQKRTEAADQCIAAIYRALLAKSRQDPAVIQHIETNCEVEGDDGSAVLVLLDGAIGAANGIPTACPEGVQPDSYRGVRISLRYHRIKATLSFELHTEFLALTTVLDASEPWTPEEIETIRTGADPVLREFHLAMTCLASVRGVDEARCQNVHEQLYHAIWDAVDEEMLAPLADLQPNLGKKFVDFRGVVLGVKGEDERSDFSEPFSGRQQERGTGLERDSKCDINDFESLWNFINCALPSETEFTLSRFLDNRAIYATALGVQPEVFLGSKHTPLYYLLFEDTLNPFQLGRLIYRIHRAGAARIAAIMHFEELRSARDILSRADNTLELAIWRMSQFEDLADPELRLKLREDQAAVEGELAKIAKLRLDGTLDSRIERSRYYVNQFARVTGGMRINRVAGFQPYDEFVQQRMGPVFEYIDSLGRIYARVQNDRAALQGRIQTLDSMHQERLIADAQRIADYGLSCVLGPYYAAYTLSHSLSGIAPDRAVWLGALFFCPMIMVTILHREQARGIEEAKRLGRSVSEEGEARHRRWSRRLRFLGARRLTMFFRLAVLALFVGVVADYALTLGGLQPEGLATPPNPQLVLFGLAAIISLIVIESARQLQSALQDGRANARPAEDSP